MAAPGGTCESCNTPLKWCFASDAMWVYCPICPDLFGQELGMDYADAVAREGHETETVNGAR